jgi:hypothetical protein
MEKLWRNIAFLHHVWIQNIDSDTECEILRICFSCFILVKRWNFHKDIPLLENNVSVKRNLLGSLYVQRESCGFWKKIKVMHLNCRKFWRYRMVVCSNCLSVQSGVICSVKMLLTWLILYTDLVVDELAITSYWTSCVNCVHKLLTMSCLCGCLSTCWNGHKRIRLVRDLSSITEVDTDTEITGVEVSIYTDTGKHNKTF